MANKKKFERPAIRGTGVSSSFPNPRYYGLKGPFWNRIQKGVDELAGIRERSGELGGRRAELEKELEFQRRRYEQERISAARVGRDEPDDKYLKLTERELANVNDKLGVLQKAYDQAALELSREISGRAPQEVLDELREQGRQHEQAYQEYVARAMRERDQLGSVYSLYLWAANRDERGYEYRDDNRQFRPTPLSPAPDNSAWYEHPLMWHEPRESEVISTQGASGFVEGS